MTEAKPTTHANHDVDDAALEGVAGGAGTTSAFQKITDWSSHVAADISHVVSSVAHPAAPEPAHAPAHAPTISHDESSAKHHTTPAPPASAQGFVHATTAPTNVSQFDPFVSPGPAAHAPAAAPHTGASDASQLDAMMAKMSSDMAAHGDTASKMQGVVDATKQALSNTQHAEAAMMHSILKP